MGKNHEPVPSENLEYAVNPKLTTIHKTKKEKIRGKFRLKKLSTLK